VRVRNRIAGLVAIAAAVALGAYGLIDRSSDSEGARPKSKTRVLVFSKTTGFRHDSIPAGVEAIRTLGRANGFLVAATENGGAFTKKRLRRYDALVFLSTTGDVLDPKQQAALRAFVRSGGGWVGIHAAADAEYDWPFYGGLLGTYFRQHPAVQQATIAVVDRKHPSTRHLPAGWTRTDEWYDFRSNPRGSVHVLATLDETTYTGGTMGPDHPIAWCQAYRGGRSWYTGGGHSSEAFAEPAFRKHLLGGILWAAGVAKGSCR
jgi:type 1 glutamine amidotransferase